MQHAQWFRWTLLAALVAVAGACKSRGTDAASVTTSRMRRDGPSIELRLDVPSRVRAGLPVPLRLSVRNVGTRTAGLLLGPEESTYNFVVRDSTGVVVWTHADGRYRVNVGRQHFLDPGDSLVFRARWMQRARGGRRVRPGTYRMQGVLRAAPLIDVPGLKTDTVNPLQGLPSVSEPAGGAGVGTDLRALRIVRWF